MLFADVAGILYRDSGWIEGLDQRIPESRNAFCRIVSLTAANTSRTLPVSVACVKLASWSVRRAWEEANSLTEDRCSVLHGSPA